MNSKPSTARIMTTDRHSLLLLLISLLSFIWTAIYPFLNPNNFQLQNALNSAAIAIIAFILAHAHASLRQQASSDDPGTTLHRAANPGDRYQR